jgi:predicted phosphoribosyltransferase
MSRAVFADHADAGRRLAALLARFAGRPEVLVLALPRGGVPVAYEVAMALHAPLDVIVVRPLRAPARPGVFLGAVGSGGMRVVEADVAARLNLSPDAIEVACAVEAAEIARRERQYRGAAFAAEVRRHTVIVVDDGLASATMGLALSVLRKQRPARLVAATPIALRGTSAGWARADETACVVTTEREADVQGCYAQTDLPSDEEVRELLLLASRAHASRVDHLRAPR